MPLCLSWASGKVFPQPIMPSCLQPIKEHVATLSIRVPQGVFSSDDSAGGLRRAV